MGTSNWTGLTEQEQMENFPGQGPSGSSGTRTTKLLCALLQ